MKNYHSKVWSCFTKVVGLFTRNPKKLSLHFSDFPTNFYGFYKFQQKAFTIEESTMQTGPWKILSFTTMPSAFTIRPLQDRNQCTWVPGGAGSSPPTRRRPDLAEERPRAQGMLTLARLEGSASAVMAPTSLPDGGSTSRC
jgi:hypothetical protein